MDAEWQYNLLNEDMSLSMDLNDPFGSIPPEMDLSLFNSYQPADDTALTMGDPLLGLAIACDEYLPDGAYPDFLADVTSRTDNSSFPNTDCPTTFDELIVSDVLGSSQNSMDHVTFSSRSSLSPGFESTIISPCITRSPALWHSPELNDMRNNISSSSSAHQYSPLSSATLSTSSPSIPSLGNATSSLVPRNHRLPEPKRERSSPSAVGRFLSHATQARLDNGFIIFATVDMRKKLF